VINLEVVEVTFNNQPFDFFIVKNKLSTHIVVYNRESKQYFCGCTDFLIRKRKSGKTCKHIDFVQEHRSDVHV